MSEYPRPTPSSASSRAPPPSAEDSDISWLDFIRTAGGTVPPERSDSAERKRRHTGSSPERRQFPQRVVWEDRPVYGMSDAGPAGSSRESAIDLTSPPPRQQPRPVREREDGSETRASTETRAAARPGGPSGQSTAGNTRGGYIRRQSSDLVLPKWQPDADVHVCPVCKAPFHFFYRKHHCRKCGRVVCSACSPHRITIPRQYIVQPPAEGEQATQWVGVSPYRSPPGGEVVRVCNPCVPDPWTPGPAAEERPRAERDDRRRRDGSDGIRQPDLYRPVPPPPPLDNSRARQPGPPPSDLSRSLPYAPSTALWPFQGNFQRAPPPPPQSNHTRPPTHRHSQSSGAVGRPTPSHPRASRPIPAPPPSAPPPRPRREVREEDECPVCGAELPPGETIRESHIQECIAARFSSTPSSAPPISAPHRSSSAQIAPEGGSDAAAAAAAVAAPPRPRATSYRPRGMAIYRATEKDCMNEEGEAQECVICFEEFQPGDEMGRMECLCKFHRVCIRQWWETKGVGSCPTHMLHQ